MLFRDRQSLFWSLVFPLLFLVIFGLFNFDAPASFDIAVIDEAQTESSQMLREQMFSLEIFTESDITNKDEAVQSMKDGELDGIIVIPDAYGQVPQNEVTEPLNFTVILDETNQQSGIIVSVLNDFLNKVNLQIAGAQPIFTVATEGVQGQDVKYLDFLTPGILGMAIMFSAIIGIAVGITRYRERKILKRLLATPIKVRNFLVAEVGSYLVLSLMQITVILSVARLVFGVEIHGSLLLLTLVTLIGTIVFLNIGFFVAGQAKTVNTAEAMSNAFTTPMMFLSGVFFSPDMLPPAVERIVDFLPLTSLLKVLRGVAVNGSPISDFGYEFSILGGWILLSFLLAWKSFRVRDV
ncbi:MAG: ABC transporter permease [Candidatus Nomurabacteria bacterium]|nr:MAG: ABC transporter permease [Candidatus Nomurabacteria bacterium]